MPEAQHTEEVVREALERFATKRCAEFSKEPQPSEWNCQRLRADHRENAADYTDESNARAERLCDSCLAREALSSPSSEEVVREALANLLRAADAAKAAPNDPQRRNDLTLAKLEARKTLSSPSLEEGEREREIWINRGRFVVRGEAMQGDALRNIPTPPISENDDLFQVTVRSSEPDLLVRPDRLVDFKAGVEFFSAPKTIQAGND